MSSQRFADAPALDNSALFRWLAITGAALVVALLAGFGLRQYAPSEFSPGSPVMQLVAIAGALMLLGAFLAALSKRVGRSGRVGLRAHVLWALAGLTLVSFHTTGSLLKPASSLLVLLFALGALGVWARTAGARQMSGVFGTRHRGFSGAAAEDRAALKALVAHKRGLLARLDPRAEERTFSLRLTHWAASPRLARQYRRAENTERRMLGTAPGSWLDSGTGSMLNRWRWVHQLLAWVFVGGLALHVVLVTWFAGYVADGRDVYWWHISAWNF